MCEHWLRAFHTKKQDGPNLRPEQLWNREGPPGRNSRNGEIKADELTSGKWKGKLVGTLRDESACLHFESTQGRPFP